MIQNLSTHEFLWKKTEGFTHEKTDKLAKKDKRGYLLEVNVQHPKGLHENHNELLFLAERMKMGKEEKLVPNLKDKKGYVVHIKALDQALKHGLKLKRVHRVIEFQQSKWMKLYIMLNTRLRKDANNEFEKVFFLIDEQQCLWKDHAKYQKSQGYEASDKRAKIFEVCHETKL